MAAGTPKDIVLGPQGSQWHYSSSTKTWDLSSSSSSASKVTFSTTEGLPETSVSLATDKTALVVVDMQNFFLDESCMAHPKGLEAVEPTVKAVEWCRRVGIQVIWLNWGLTEDDMSTLPPSVLRGFAKHLITPPPDKNTPLSYTGLGSDLGGTKGRTLFAGSWNADIYPPLKKIVSPQDLHCAKNRMSGLWSPSQPLWKTLKEKDIQTAMFAGVNTDQCVLGTLVDAYNNGWGCVMVDDCCGTTTEGGREVSLYNVSSSYGFVTSSTKLLASEGGVE